MALFRLEDLHNQLHVHVGIVNSFVYHLLNVQTCMHDSHWQKDLKELPLS